MLSHRDRTRAAILAAIAAVFALSAGACGSAAPRKPLSGELRPPVPPPTASSVPLAAPAIDGSAGNGPIGTAHPLVLEATAPDGRWAVLCQPRADTNRDGRIAVTLGARGELGGDALESYLVIGSGSGERIDELVASDGTGRYLAVVRDARLLVIDTQLGKVTDLGAKGADPRTDAGSHRAHRAAAFYTAGKAVVYLRKVDGRSFAVVHQLESGVESAVDAGQGEIWRAELTSAGLVLRVVVDDSNKNGRIELPAPLVAKNPWRCQGPIPSYAAFQDVGDLPRTFVAEPSGALRELRGFVSSFGPGFLRREPDGKLVLERAGTTLELSDGRCGARVLHADPARELLLVACTAERGRSPVRLVGPRLRVDLGVSVEPRSIDRGPEATPRLVALQPGADDVLVDLERRELVRLESGQTVIATHQSRALLRRGRELFVFDGETRKESKLPGELSDSFDFVRQPPLVFMTPLVVDLERGAVLGSLDARPLALTTDKRALLANQVSSSSELALGPLSFRTVEPLTTNVQDAAVDKGQKNKSVSNEIPDGGSSR